MQRERNDRFDAGNASQRASDRGAALVEFGLVVPVMLMLVFAVFEFGVMFGTQLDVRNGSREAARLAAVNYQSTDGSSGATQTTELVTEVCSRMELADTSTVTVTFPGDKDLGDSVVVEVRQSYATVTGFYDAMLAGRVLSSTVETRLEQDATFDAVSQQACP